MTTLRFFFVKYRSRLKSSLVNEPWAEDIRSVRAASQDDANDLAKHMIFQEKPDHLIEILS